MVEPADTPNELMEFIALSIESMDLGSGDIPRVCLGGTRAWTSDANGLGDQMDGLDSQMDGSRGLADESKGLTDMMGQLNNAKMDRLDHGEGAGTYLGTGDPKCLIQEMDSDRNHTDTTANTTNTVKTAQKKAKPPDSPIKPNIATSKCAYQWRKVSAGDSNVYILWNMPIEALGRTLAFGEVKSGVKVIVPNIEGERAGDGDGNRDGDVGGMDGTMSGISMDSIQVNEVLLAVGSQHTHQTQRLQNGDLPMSSKPPIYHANHLYRLITQCHQCSRIKSEPIKAKPVREVETTHLRHINATQLPPNASKHSYRVIGPSWI